MSQGKQRGKTVACVATLMGIGGILAALLLFQDQLINRYRTWRAEKAAEDSVRKGLTDWLITMSMEEAPLERFVDCLSAMTDRDIKINGLVQIGHDESAPKRIRFVLTPRAAAKAKSESLGVTFTVREKALEEVLKAGLASTGHKFRYWIKGDSVQIDLGCVTARV